MPQDQPAWSVSVQDGLDNFVAGEYDLEVIDENVINPDGNKMLVLSFEFDYNGKPTVATGAITLKPTVQPTSRMALWASVLLDKEIDELGKLSEGDFLGKKCRGTVAPHRREDATMLRVNAITN